MEYTDIKKIIEDMGNSNLDNLEIEFPDGLKIKMEKDCQKKDIAISYKENQNNIKSQELEKDNFQTIKNEELQERENYKLVKSPMVGTFYESSSPKANPFVKVGDKVKKGQVICIVEAMKLMNEIEAEFDGEIVEVCKKNEDMVEYGEILFKIK